MCTLIGNFSPVPLVSKTFLTNMICFVTLGSATYLASVDERVALLLEFCFHAISDPQKYRFQPKH